MFPFPVLAIALAEGEGPSPTTTLGFIILCVLGTISAWLLFSGKNVPLGAVLGVIALMILWHMADLPMPNIDWHILSGESAFIVPINLPSLQRLVALPVAALSGVPL